VNEVIDLSLQLCSVSTSALPQILHYFWGFMAL